jgi:hypothetical protein
MVRGVPLAIVARSWHLILLQRIGHCLKTPSLGGCHAVLTMLHFHII